MGHFAASSSQGPLHPQMLLQQQQQQQHLQHLQLQGHINPDMGSHPSNTNRGMGSTQATPMNLQMNDHFFNNSNFPAVGSTQQPFQSPQQQQPPISMLMGGGTMLEGLPQTPSMFPTGIPAAPGMPGAGMQAMQGNAMTMGGAPSQSMIGAAAVTSANNTMMVPQQGMMGGNQQQQQQHQQQQQQAQAQAQAQAQQQQQQQQQQA